MLIFYIVNQFFSHIFIILGADVEENDDLALEGRMLLKTFLSGLGAEINWPTSKTITDLKKPLKNEHSPLYNTLLSEQRLLWLVWLLSIYINTTILLNFLIANTGELYSEMMEKKSHIEYANKLEMIDEVNSSTINF